jgi:ABC-type dipeptide/oligopeptide/nickel transport system permease subunit
VAAVALAAALAPLLAPFDPQALPPRPGAAGLQPPGAPFYLGTDFLGRDLLSRILYAARVSLAVALGIQAVAAGLGLLVGLAAGCGGGRVDAALMRLADVVTAVPALALAIGVIAGFESPGLDKVALVLGGLGGVAGARMVRGEVRALREREFVTAAVALGAPAWALVGRHVLPHLRVPLLVAAAEGVAWNMTAEAGLSFLGLGAQPPTISWGGMLAEGHAFLTIAPWIAVFPGAALLLAILGFHLLGAGLRERLHAGRAGPDAAPSFTWPRPRG